MNADDGKNSANRKSLIESESGPAPRRPLPTLDRIILLAAQPARGVAARMPYRPVKRFLRY